MAPRTRRGSCNSHPVSAAALLALLAALAWSAPGGVRAQPAPGQPGPQAGPGPQQPPSPGGQAGQPTPPPAAEVPSVPPGAQPPGPEPTPPILQNPPAVFDGPAPPPQRFQITIDPKTPLKDLLPTPPKAKAVARRGPADDLASVPELDLQAALPKGVDANAAAQHTAEMLAKINFLNGKQSDGFLKALRGERADLDGLPFAMGDACRTKGERTQQFAHAVALVRQALQNAAGAQDPTGLPAGDRFRAEGFWDQYNALCAQEDHSASRINRDRCEAVAVERVAALMQILAPEAPDLRLGLVKYLSGVARPEATRALARLAIFSAEDEVRQAALEALQVRRERDYTDVLVTGLRYPWPAVARNSAAAVAKLGRTDLAPQLVAMLDDPDPRDPTTQEIDKKPALVVREVVRVNHHRNCMLCHAPGNADGASTEALKAPIPLPTEPLGTPVNGYQSSTPELLARIDVTYLRQDFSLMQPVEDAGPWPEMQRFDFLVRTRVVSEDEAAQYREQLDKREPGVPSPYQRAALVALRDLTGKEAGPTAEAWRKILGPAAEGP